MAVSEKSINEVLSSAWEVAVHRNPMLLASYQLQPVIVRVRQRIKELLAQGCSVTEARRLIVKDLLDPKSSLFRNSH